MKSRNTARIVLINSRKEILLLEYLNSEPLDPEKPELTRYWVPPGGEIEGGETAEEALQRELREEVDVEKFKVRRSVWIRRLKLKIDGELRQIVETYFVGYYNGKAMLTIAALKEGIVNARWWKIAEMRTTSETLLPPGLPDLVSPLLDGNLPPRVVEL